MSLKLLMNLQKKIEQLSITDNFKLLNFPDSVSLVLHQIVAVRLRSNPLLLEDATLTLDKWLAKNPNINAWLEWKRVLETQSFENILKILTDETAEGQRLRSSSPFVGFVTDQERKSVIEYCEKAKPF